MNTIYPNQKIFNLKTLTNHVVESVEYHENVTVVFTQDSKCFDIKDVVFNSNQIIFSHVEKVYNNNPYSKDEEHTFVSELSKFKFLTVNPNFEKNLDQLLEEYSKNKLVKKSPLNLNSVLNFFRKKNYQI